MIILFFCNKFLRLLLVLVFDLLVIVVFKLDLGQEMGGFGLFGGLVLFECLLDLEF